MKGKLCGLLLALFITLGLSLSINLNDTSALKYSYNAFPVIRKEITAGQNQVLRNTSSTFNISFDSDYTPNSVSAPSGQYRRMDYSNSQCSLLETRNIFIYSSSNSLYSVSGTDATGFSRVVNAIPPRASDYSSPTSFLSPSVSCYASSGYDFDSIYAGTIDTSTGDYDKYIDISGIYGDFSRGGVRSLNIPLDISQKNVGTVSANTPLEWTFELFSLNPLSNIASSPYISIHLSYFPLDFDTYTGTVSDFANSRTSVDISSCTVDPNHEFLKVNEDLTFTHMYGYQVKCSYTPSTDMSYIQATLVLSGDEYFTTNLFTFTQYLYFGSSYFVTNNDDTYSGTTANDAPTGDDIEEAPGYASLYCDNAATCDDPADICAEGDFLCDLSHLFSFNFINPFEPILHLFTDNGSCVQIPTIAGMIHSNETQVCPWFDSNVRNIVTPVLGLSSMMLVFGFAVRWLGARSGNLFEDSFEGSSGDISVGSRGRSRK